MANYKSRYTGQQIDEGVGRGINALQKPTTAPTNEEIVGIGTDGEQTRIAIGNGLTLDNGILSANGGANNYINVKDHGVIGDGVTDDTLAIQQIFNNATANTTIYFPDGKYMITNVPSATYPYHGQNYDATWGSRGTLYLKNKTDITILLDPNAMIKQMAADTDDSHQTNYYYSNIFFDGCTRCKVIGGILEGDWKLDDQGQPVPGYRTHFKYLNNDPTSTYTEEHGHGITVNSSTDCSFENIEIRNFYGDGAGFTYDGNIENLRCSIKNCNIHYIARNGVTFGFTNKCVIEDTTIYDVGGGLPQSGIDVEVEMPNTYNKDLLFKGLKIYNCKSYGIIFAHEYENAKLMNSTVDSITTTIDGNLDIEASTIQYLSGKYTVCTGCNIGKYACYGGISHLIGCYIGGHLEDSTNKELILLDQGSSGEKGNIYLNSCTLNATSSQNGYDIIRVISSNTNLDINSCMFNLALTGSGSSGTQFSVGTAGDIRFINNIVKTTISNYLVKFVNLAAANKVIFENNICDNSISTSKPEASNMITLSGTTIFVKNNTIVAPSIINRTYNAPYSLNGNIQFIGNIVPLWNNFGVLVGGDVILETLNVYANTKSLETTKADNDELQALKAKATSSYCLSLSENPDFNTSDNTIDFTTVTDINGKVVSYDEMILGNLLLFAEDKTKNRFVSGFVGIPDTFVQLSYLQSSGTQFIDTGYKATAATGISLSFAVTKSDYYNAGYMGNDDISCGNITDGRAFYGTKKSYSMGNFGSGNHTIQSNYLNDGKARYDGEIKDWNAGTVTIHGTNNITLFKANSNTSFSNNAYIKIYEAYITEGNAIIKHYVPVRRKSDNALGVYELNSGAFIQNSGSGTFTGGTEVPSSVTAGKASLL